MKSTVKKEGTNVEKKSRLDEFNLWLDVIQKVVFIVGIPITIYSYFLTKEKERNDQEYFIYDNMDKKYWEYETVAAQYPLLGISDATLIDTNLKKLTKPDSLLTIEERIHTRQMMFLLIAMYERAFVMYSGSDNEIRKRQWEGWSGALNRWIKEGKFVDAWQITGQDFDSKFQEYVNNQIQLNGAK